MSSLIIHQAIKFCLNKYFKNNLTVFFLFSLCYAIGNYSGNEMIYLIKEKNKRDGLFLQVRRLESLFYFSPLPAPHKEMAQLDWSVL
jgi:hypothetical protein